MIIERNISPYCVRSDEPLRIALSRIDVNRRGVIFCVDALGALEGILTDGDFRRACIRKTELNMSSPVIDIANRRFVSARWGGAPEIIQRLLSDEIHYVPLLDDQGRMVALARRRDEGEGFKIDGRMIGDLEPVFIIAEIGINHNGSVERARRLIEAARGTGVDCVKFQMRNLSALYRSGPSGGVTDEDLGTQYTLNLLERFELPATDLLLLFDYTREQGLIPMCTPWDPESLRILEEYGMGAFKIASADLTNHDLLLRAARLCKPLIVSTGMSTEHEICEAVELLTREGAPFALLQCNSTYPAPFKDVNLNYINRLKEIGHCLVGYSGHERGYHVAVAAVAKGARIIEKHFTLDRSLEGSDHKVSLLPDEFKAMVEAIRDVESAQGTGGARFVTQGEMINRTNLSKSLVAGRDVRAGQAIHRNMILIRSPGRGLQPNRIDELIGRTLSRDIKAGDFFYPSDLDEEVPGARTYRFRRRWGVPVRWHDFRTMLEHTAPDFIEFHLSFKDLDEDFTRFFDGTFDMDFTVHSPDVFAGDHLMDLSSEDPDYRARSVAELQRVIRMARKLKPYFQKARFPLIIASLGGFSSDRLIEHEEVRRRYAIMAESLRTLDCEGVEIVGQTLPPFPWYFGGQRCLNLFVNPEDTAEFCEQQHLRICLDVCHSKLACNHYRRSFKELIDKLGPYTAHLHLADAKGVDGEGLQIGDGDIDFPALRDQLDRVCPYASFIPEIWQGHKNGGEGFWIALDRLEKDGW